jgi:hypothetical protein
MWRRRSDARAKARVSRDKVFLRDQLPLWAELTPAADLLAGRSGLFKALEPGNKLTCGVVLLMFPTGAIGEPSLAARAHKHKLVLRRSAKERLKAPHPLDAEHQLILPQMRVALEGLTLEGAGFNPDLMNKADGGDEDHG